MSRSLYSIAGSAFKHLSTTTTTGACSPQRIAFSRCQVHSRACHESFDSGLESIRNIGIIAHVDAGKTTTTERMLYYSGVTQRVGDVDSGNTVTDFLELERARGITIQSAAITFPWPPLAKCPAGIQPKTVNLIDTPGHQDFRFEGVEAHTERVWASAHDFGIPRIVYCNKLDRDGASFRKSVLDIGTRLKGWPLVCQIPWWERDDFVGVIDIIDRVGYRWKSIQQKTVYDFQQLSDVLKRSNESLLNELQVARQRLIEGLAEFDEAVMNEYLAENPDIPASLLKAGIRRAIQRGDGRAIPVFAGSSSRHIGVEPLMDAIIEYLPSPIQRPDVEISLGSSKHKLSDVLDAEKKKYGRSSVTSVASVFKVFNHAKEGVLSFVRVYYGTLMRNASTYNTNIMLQERPMGIVQVSASKTQDVPELSVGNIGALRGLKKARSGDTLIATTASGKVVPEALRQMRIRPPEIPPPVAFLQADAYGLVAAEQLAKALENASREDPSLRWNRDEKTDQFTIQGMGKLHLEVSLHNIRQKHQIDAEFGQVEVDYKECITIATPPQYAVFDRCIASKAGKAACTVVLEPMDAQQLNVPKGIGLERDGNLIQVEIDLRDASKEVGFEVEEARQQLINGAIAGLARGPRRASPVHSCRVKVTLDTSPGALESPSGGHFSNAARAATQAALRDAHSKQQVAILEPIMLTHITCPEAVAGTVQHDIMAGAGGHVLEVSDRSGESMGQDGVDVSRIYAPRDPYDSITSLRGKKSTSRLVEIVAKVPYKEMLSYDDHLRSKTAGRHSITMSFDSFARVVGQREKGL
ncbi:hypothetical protein CDD82_1409 [Ophiocordyceps australis]|uniref:Tr-type G domain-containing protein n=1 Tax=Ophiocordyceps australis TaxID=1399860 RepID=A0A2C5ZMG1_9HYPO|nr:hypothetical protein CDD82_1409 [Ophiocordyceps australis]